MHASLLPGQSPRLFDHFENLSFLLLGTSGVENRAHRRDSFALFSNHLANIVFRNPQFDHDCVLSFYPSDLDIFRIFNDGPGNLLD